MLLLRFATLPHAFPTLCYFLFTLSLCFATFFATHFYILLRFVHGLLRFATLFARFAKSSNAFLCVCHTFATFPHAVPMFCYVFAMFCCDMLRLFSFCCAFATVCYILLQVSGIHIRNPIKHMKH